MKKIIFLMTLSLTMLTSCFYTQYITGSVRLTETNPEDIMVFSRDIDQDYVVIGSVAADVIGDGDAVVKHLKKKAAQLGADAIIKVKLTKPGSSSIHTGISGVAVKMKGVIAQNM